MRSFSFPMHFKPEKDGGYVVTCRDVSEAITQGDSLKEAIEAAEGALQAALEMRIQDSLEIPTSSEPRRGERLVSPPITTALKAALHVAMREQHMSKSELARRLGVNEKEARRLLNSGHASKAPALERAIQALGKRVEVLIS